MGRDSHYRTRPVAGQHIVAHPHGDGFTGQRILGIRACEDSRHTPVADTLTLGAFFGRLDVGIHLITPVVGSKLGDQFTLGSEHHERHPEDRVGACREYGELLAAAFHLEAQLCTLRAAYPVALRLLERICPIDGLKPCQQPLGVGRHAQAPLFHHALHHRVAATL